MAVVQLGAMNAEKKMLPCPFCGRTDLLGVEHHPEKGFLCVRCRACGAIGPAGRSVGIERAVDRAEAIAHWNRCAESPEQAARRALVDMTEYGDLREVVADRMTADVVGLLDRMWAEVQRRRAAHDDMRWAIQSLVEDGPNSASQIAAIRKAYQHAEESDSRVLPWPP